MVEHYVHGYDGREAERLADQADALVDLLHDGTSYPPGARVLEIGCGVGAQTVTLAARSPDARITAVDIDHASLRAAAQRCAAAGVSVGFVRGDLTALPFPPGSFDHVFVCFVLEHLPRPDDALRTLGDLLRPGGTVTVIEGDHGSALLHPDHPAATAVIAALVELQRRAGGNALVGRALHPLLVAGGFAGVGVGPRMVYVDRDRPDLAEGFTLRTFTAMVEGVRGPATEAGLVGTGTFDAGVAALRRAAAPDGVFCYTFFKGVGHRPGG